MNTKKRLLKTQKSHPSDDRRDRIKILNHDYHRIYIVQLLTDWFAQNNVGLNYSLPCRDSNPGQPRSEYMKRRGKPLSNATSVWTVTPNFWNCCIFARPVKMSYRSLDSFLLIKGLDMLFTALKVWKFWPQTYRTSLVKIFLPHNQKLFGALSTARTTWLARLTEIRPRTNLTTKFASGTSSP